MASFVVWAEAVDFTETLFDTEKLSVVRGASRTLEALPHAATKYFEQAGFVTKQTLKPVTSGASRAGFLVDGDESKVRTTLEGFANHVAAKGRNHNSVKAEVAALGRNATESDVLDAAPFAPFRILHAMVPVLADDEAAALHKAQAAIRRQQLDGRNVLPLARNGRGDMCFFDRKRAATDPPVLVPREDTSEPSHLSSETAARWYYGRSERQLLYMRNNKSQLRFTDDFQTMVEKPPMLEGRALAASVQGKIAVFSADGDKFGSRVIPDLVKACGGLGAALRVLSYTLAARMDSLLKTLLTKLEAMPGDVAAVAEDGTRKLRFETLVFGGDDVMFVVPGWLGFWLLETFHTETAEWAVTHKDAEAALGTTGIQSFHVPLSFSCGLVFANHKAPIRTLRKLSIDLQYSAKSLDGGGYDLEFLESIEPPHGGLAAHRKAMAGTSQAVHFAISRDELPSRLAQLRSFWCGDNPFPASQAYRALTAGRTDRNDQDRAVRTSLERSRPNLAPSDQIRLDRSGLLNEGRDGTFLQLFRMLQMRDYIRADGVTNAGAAQP